MIKIYIGNVGSGKTAYAVRESFKNKGIFQTYSNIKIKSKHNTFISEKELFTDISYNKNNELETNKLKLNTQFWQNLNENINVVLDEAHTLFNSRRSMTKINILLTEWIALIRKLLGTNPNSEGDLILISQLWYRLDNITRDMAHQVKYFIRHNKKKCNNCKIKWVESSDDYEQIRICPKCESLNLIKYDFRIEVYVFDGINSFIQFKDFNQKTYFKHYIVNDIEDYFKYYDTLQWDNLISNLY